MSEKWIWLPDWASDLSLWEDDLVVADASANHNFISYEKMAQSFENVYDISGLSSATTVVGWGLGALALLKSVSHRPKGQKWILLSAFADFCDDSSAWTKQNLTFMAKQMLTTTEPGLNSFEELLSEEFGEWQDEWRKAANKMKAPLLSDGINYMVSNKLSNVIENGEDIQVLYGRMDRAVPPAQTLKLKSYLPAATFRERPKAGHWPPMLIL